MMSIFGVLALFLLVWAIIFFRLGLLKRGELKHLRNGRPVDATIISHSADRSKYGYVESQAPQNYALTYRYQYGGKEYKITHPVSKNNYQRWSYGHIVAAACLPNKPNVAMLAEDLTYWKQESSKAKRYYALGILPVFLLVLEGFLIWGVTK